MNDQQELRQRREALAEAVNAHKLESVKSFVDPSYVGKTKLGISSSYQDIMRMVERLFAPGSDFQETVEIEDISVSREEAHITVCRSSEMSGWLLIKQRSKSRAIETWKKVDGVWRLFEEQAL